MATVGGLWATCLGHERAIGKDVVRISTSPSALWTSGRRFAKCQRAGAQCIIGGFLCAIPLRKRCRSFAKGHLSESKPGNGNECFSPFPAGYELYNSVVRFIGTHGTGQSWQMRQALMPSGQLKLKVIVEAGLGWHTIHWEGVVRLSSHLARESEEIHTILCSSRI
ncbi:unnamed protein product [Durusdinium trenchii]|uniref:Uncharacterized protein n=1 Tax=Durusdinium trenchii TaxID=1381693 RepID=A0ABP0RWT6_9DINO